MSGLTRDELKNLAVGLPIVTAIVGALAGLGMGFALGWGLKPALVSDAQVAQMPLEAFTPDQIQFKCGQIKGEELENANARIRLLEDEKKTFERRVKALQAELEDVASKPAPVEGSRSGAVAARALQVQKELEEARRQLADVRTQLDAAQEEKRQLQAALATTTRQLQQTEVALEQQVGMTEEARENALGQAWWRFLGEAQLEICERGNRKKLGRCREEVEAHLQTGSLRRAFAHCVRSRQATPNVAKIERGASLPMFAQFLGEDSRVTKDWYVQLCDPTLPEAKMGTRPAGGF